MQQKEGAGAQNKDQQLSAAHEVGSQASSGAIGGEGSTFAQERASSTTGAATGKAIDAAPPEEMKSKGYTTTDALNEKLAQVPEVKMNWEGRDLKVVSFTDDGRIELQLPPSEKGSTFAPLTAVNFEYLINRIYV